MKDIWNQTLIDSWIVKPEFSCTFQTDLKVLENFKCLVIDIVYLRIENLKNATFLLQKRLTYISFNCVNFVSLEFQSHDKSKLEFSIKKISEGSSNH
jgi:hypothetical protein